MPAARRWAGGAVTLALALLVPAGARGQAPSDAQRAVAAQALYDQATSEMDVGSYAAACPRLEEVTRLIPEGIGAKLTLARCYEGAGKLASAWAQYSLVAAMADKPGQQERAKTAKARAELLRPKLAHVTIDVPEELRAIAGLAIACDGVPVGAPQWGMPLPMDVGEHLIVASAPGRTTWNRRFSIKSEGESVSVVVGPIPIEQPAPPPPEPPATRAARPPERPAPAEPPERPFQRPLGIAGMAVGGAGLVAGGVLGLLAISSFNDSNNGHCTRDHRCDKEGLALRSEAVVFGNASTAVFIAGGAVLAGGVILFATAPRASASGARVRSQIGGVATSIALLPGGVRVTGSW